MDMSVIALVGLVLIMLGVIIYMYCEIRKMDRELNLFIDEATRWREKYYRFYNLWRYGDENFHDDDSDYD